RQKRPCRVLPRQPADWAPHPAACGRSRELRADKLNSSPVLLLSSLAAVPLSRRLPHRLLLQRSCASGAAIAWPNALRLLPVTVTTTNLGESPTAHSYPERIPLCGSPRR